jgi:hypothetical protein
MTNVRRMELGNSFRHVERDILLGQSGNAVGYSPAIGSAITGRVDTWRDAWTAPKVMSDLLEQGESQRGLAEGVRISYEL